jgi:hypothetical protein
LPPGAEGESWSLAPRGKGRELRAKGRSWSLTPRGEGRKLVPERLISVHRVALEPPSSI